MYNALMCSNTVSVITSAIDICKTMNEKEIPSPRTREIAIAITELENARFRLNAAYYTKET